MRLASLIAIVALAAACSSPTSPSTTTTTPTPTQTTTTPAPTTPSVSNIAGTWTGTLTQANGPVGTTFRYKLVLTQNGSSVSGVARTELDIASTGGGRGGGAAAVTYFTELAVTGAVSGSAVTVKEGAVISQNSLPNGAFWCTKAATLTIAASGSRLTGPWSAPGCEPGQVDVQR